MLSALLVVGCPDDDAGGMEEGSEEEGGSDGVQPVFPEDYEASYAEVRTCRSSPAHGFNNVRVLADPAAFVPYDGRTQPFPEGAVVVKEEYDAGDAACEGSIKQWTVMRKLAPGSAPETLDWAWQQVDFDRRVIAEDSPLCIHCHEACAPPDGYEGTCAPP